MATNKRTRSYNCKDEELPIIAGFVLTNFKRDQYAFVDYSPHYNNEYATTLEQEINDVSELDNPRSETNTIKRITSWLYENMDTALDISHRLEGYINMAQNQIHISPKDFGITNLRNSIKARDTEGAISSLKFVSANIAQHKTELQAQGLKDETIKKLIDLTATIISCNNDQYTNTISRKDTVHVNIYKMNALNAKICEICRTAKIIFRRSNPEKIDDYTFTKLLKKVRVVYKSTKPGETGETNTGNTDTDTPQQ